MSYEEKYKEALKRADSLTEKYGGREFAEYVFPELAESEDERMVNALISYFEWYERSNPTITGIPVTIDGFSVRDVIAWLEKQKERKPAEWSDYKDKVNVPYCSSEPEWSEENERIYNKALDAIYYKDLNDKDEVVDSLKALWDLIARKRKVIPPYAHWKPSEEQMEALKCAVEDVAKFSKRGGRQVELENEPYYSALHSLYCNLEKLM